MRRLKRDRVTGVTANSTQDNYPSSYTMDEYPSRVWKAKQGISNATLIVDVLSGFSDLMIFGTNAESATVTVTDPNQIEFGFDADEFGFAADYFINDKIDEVQSTTQTSKTDALHIQLSTPVTLTTKVSIVLSGSGQLYAGKILADNVETYGGKDPFYGMALVPVDRSLQNEYPRYYSKRDVCDIWSITMRLTSTNANQFMADFSTYGSANSGWKLTDESGSEFLCFGWVSQPVETFDLPDHRTISFNLTEVK